MKVELLLNDDAELRAYIKELIKNEVINISREQVKEIVITGLNQKLKNSYDVKKIDLLIEEQIARQIGYLLKNYWSNSTQLDNYINNRIKDLLNKYLLQLGLDVIKNND
jgi:hypothetical protein